MQSQLTVKRADSSNTQFATIELLANRVAGYNQLFNNQQLGPLQRRPSLSTSKDFNKVGIFEDKLAPKFEEKTVGEIVHNSNQLDLSKGD